MNMVSESDLPRPVSAPMLNAPAGPGERLDWRKHAEQLHDNFNRPGERLGWRQHAEQLHDSSSGPGAAGSADPE